MGDGMPTNVEEELKAFERDLATLVARFMRLYDHVEREVRPATKENPPPPLLLRGPPPPLQGYC